LVLVYAGAVVSEGYAIVIAHVRKRLRWSIQEEEEEA
jgi:hypothetical protein